jgi:hypothetical protein
MGQRVAAAGLAQALRNGQQVDVVVAQQALGGVAQRLHAPQAAQRIGAAVDQIAQEKRRVAAG